ncbi:hypothetical protein FQA39_LY03163 [Lamprigera yunnana]|nr:hypothetical protein FQA39_LY03163 [Lamprigera yunnana]
MESVQNVFSYREAELDSDHFLVITKMRQSVEDLQKKNTRKERRIKMYVARYSILFLCPLIASVASKCTTTYITVCEKVSEVQRLGEKSWENLMISPDTCNKAKVNNLNEVLSSDAFAEAKNIEELFILEKVTGIEPGAFNGLSQLTYIKLYKNQIVVIPKDAFSNLPNIIKIDLQHNFIENTVHGLFGNSSVQFINLSHNKLNNIQVGKFDIPSLLKVVLQENHISYIAPGSFHENLEHLNLAHNNIASFDRGVLEPLRNLKELLLCHNRIKGISLNYGLPNLVSLDLSHNQIVNIEDGSFHQFLELKHLKLNHNYITHVSHNIFSNKNQIRSLHLHYNAIVHLFDPVGQILKQLEEITLSGNPWACPCLKEMTSYVAERNISQPECDKNYFKVGKSAVCIVTEDVCTGGEELTKETYQNFQNSLNVDLCSNL